MTRRALMTLYFLLITSGCVGPFKERADHEPIGCNVVSSNCDFPGCVINAHNECSQHRRPVGTIGAADYEVQLQQCFIRATQQSDRAEEAPLHRARCARTVTKLAAIDH
jgi:hypothetical protein